MLVGCLVALVVVAATPLVLDWMDVTVPGLGIGRRVQIGGSMVVAAILLLLPQLGLGLLITVFAPFLAGVRSVDDVFESPVGLVLIAIGTWLYLNVIGHFVGAMATGPGFCGAAARAVDDGGGGGGWAARCRVCDAWVSERDHHCPALGTCVGRENARSFVLFVVYLWAGVVYATAVSAAAYATCGRECGALEGMEVLVLPLGVVTLPLTAFSALVVRLAWLGVPMSEWMRARRSGRSVRCERLRTVRGWAALGAGKGMVAWLLPV